MLTNNPLMSVKSCIDTVFIDRNILKHSKQTAYCKERAHCKRRGAEYLRAGISLTCGLIADSVQIKIQMVSVVTKGT